MCCILFCCFAVRMLTIACPLWAWMFSSAAVWYKPYDYFVLFTNLQIYKLNGSSVALFSQRNGLEQGVVAFLLRDYFVQYTVDEEVTLVA